jgi:hypothetical protein
MQAKIYICWIDDDSLKVKYFLYIHTSEVIQVEQNVHNCNANK